MEFSDVSQICEDSFVARWWGEELYIQDNIHIVSTVNSNSGTRSLWFSTNFNQL